MTHEEPLDKLRTGVIGTAEDYAEGFAFPCGQRSEMLCGCTIEPFSDVMRLNLCPLHAAAPDLLTALGRAVSHHEDNTDYDWIGAATNAVAKAKGSAGEPAALPQPDVEYAIKLLISGEYDDGNHPLVVEALAALGAVSCESRPKAKGVA